MLKNALGIFFRVAEQRGRKVKASGKCSVLLVLNCVVKIVEITPSTPSRAWICPTLHVHCSSPFRGGNTHQVLEFSHIFSDDHQKVPLLFPFTSVGFW